MTALFVLMIFFFGTVFFFRLFKSSESDESATTPVLKNESTEYALCYANIQNQLDRMRKIPADSPTNIGKYLVIDTETTGFPKKRHTSAYELSNWPYIVEIAWILVDKDGLRVSDGNYIVKQEIPIPKQASDVHHITTQRMREEGDSPKEVYGYLMEDLNNTEFIIAHNLEFDYPIIACEFIRNGIDIAPLQKKLFCTMQAGRKIYDCFASKNPKNVELFMHTHFHDKSLSLQDLHNAASDMMLTFHSFWKMLEHRPNLPYLYPINLDFVFAKTETEENVLVIEKTKNEDVSFQIGECEDIDMIASIPILEGNELFDFFDKDLFEGKQVVVTGVATDEKEKYWGMIEDLGGKVVKSVTVNLGVVILGPAPGWKKIEKIRSKIQKGENIVGIYEYNFDLVYSTLRNNVLPS